MPHSPHVAQYSRDDHLRHLLDQRNGRADLHGRFDAISEYTDTPSVYSRAFFSPRPSDNSDVDDNIYDSASPNSPSSRLRSNNAHHHDPSSSMLDLEYDSRSSYMRSDSPEDEHVAYNDGGDIEPSRMSYLGPKVHIHSRAPWEMDGDAFDEEDEEPSSPRHFNPGFPFSRPNSSKSNPAGPSSPRPSYAGARPSGESSRSQVPPKRSFETINSQISHSRGALYALAQESMSATSLGRFAPGAPKETLRNKFSLGRLRPATPNGPPPPLPSTNGRFPPSVSDYTSMHPYANPDLVVSYSEEEQLQSTDTSISNYPPSRNDSSITVTETFSADSVINSSVQSTLTPDTSVNSMLSKRRASSILARNISSPVPVAKSPQRTESSASDNSLDHFATGLPPNLAKLPGWTERSAAPTFSLISLEEARAQRARSTSFNQESSRISSASATSNTSASVLVAETETPSNAQGVDVSPAPSIPSRARGRTISAGTKARNALQTIVGQPKMDHRNFEPLTVGPALTYSTPPGKSLKHKKSGFMRLFNGNKLQEKEERDEVPPPVPALPETDIVYHSMQRTPRSNIQRIPVPSLSPSLFEAASTLSADSSGESPSQKGHSLSPRRTPPTLSINTIPRGLPRSSASAIVDNQSHLESIPRPWLKDQQPQSAPANTTEFPALRLRPVSTLFSAHFGDHIVPTLDGRSSDETTDPDTPSSPNGHIFPITPAPFVRKSEDHIAITSSFTDDQAIIKNLQIQMASAKTAWQRHIWELEGQVRDLKVELEETKGKYGDEHCNTCGRGKKKVELPVSAPVVGGVVNRPRARTGTSSRFTNAHS